MALSSQSPTLGVTQQVWSLGSPDFPQKDRLSYLSATTAPPLSISSLYYGYLLVVIGLWLNCSLLFVNE
ncbi:hypothetical protein H1P_290028 [Hyella patelloides LEGE 07179]|uniref:Uncharacterized protein n=1 Tax=Hyella patelloides LEGE 07179 TaxID=945734 RepID=A0A563VTW8_9CYAN|nr:hypothetical protein H1P_290028 [Hyella patelloides LEGE 07179]